MRTPSFELSAIVGPVRVETDLVTGNTVLTHLQKYSRCGFLLTWPFCFHIWFSFKPQQQDTEGTWLPGTETVLYIRTPGYRYDKDLGMKWTWGYLGLRWD